MSQVISHITVSLDGFSAGPRQSLENPLGEGAMRLHEWLFHTSAFAQEHDPAAVSGQDVTGAASDADERAAAAMSRDVGAYIMGRNMFGAGRGGWDLSWEGWWGPNPPYHAPVFVLTHHDRPPLEMEGGTTFFFVTDGIEAALSQALTAAGSARVHVAGGASTVRQYLAAGLLDELHLHVSPVLLGEGERLLEGLGGTGGVGVESIAVEGSERAAHLSYRVLRSGA